MVKRIGIVTSDPAIAHAVYQQVIERYDIQEPYRHLDVAVYTRSLKNPLPELDVYEGTEAMRKLDVKTVLFPERDFSDQNELPNRVALAHGLPPLTSINDTAGIALWAEAAIAVAENKTAGQIEIIERSLVTPNPYLATEAGRRDRHANPGFVAIQGGIGVESGNDALEYITQKHGVAVFLMSQSRVLDFTEPILEMVNARLAESPVVEAAGRILKETRNKIEALHPDALFMTCNSAHFYQELLEQEARVPAVSLIERGIAAIPRDSEVLLLASTQTVVSQLFQDEAERQQRQDIRWIIPDGPQQQSINFAIFHGFARNAHDRGKAIMEYIVEEYAEKIADQEHCKVLSGCTEIIMGIGGKVPQDQIIETSRLAADEAADIAKKASKNREKPSTEVSGLAREEKRAAKTR